MEDLLFSYADPHASAFKRKLILLVERATGQRRLKRIYLEHVRHPVARESFFQSAVRRLALDVRYDAGQLARMPEAGPLVVVANHPYGVLDGIVISWLVERVRRDFVVLTNAVLLRAPEIQPHVLPVDFTGTRAARDINLRSRAAARAHLRAGGCVVVFPAGGVSTAPDRLGRRPAIDAPWQAFAAQLIHTARATVVPIRFHGQNSRLFQIASHLSPVLRLSLIFHEVRTRIGTAMLVAIGRPIPFADLPAGPDRQGVADHLKALTYGLASAFPHLAGSQSLPVEGRRRVEAPFGALKRRMTNGKRKVAERLRQGRPRRQRLD